MDIPPPLDSLLELRKIVTELVNALDEYVQNGSYQIGKYSRQNQGEAALAKFNRWKEKYENENH